MSLPTGRSAATERRFCRSPAGYSPIATPERSQRPGYGTALGVIRAAWESGKLVRVFHTETRPWLQGARLTAWEFARLGIPATLIVDSAAGALMASGSVAAVVTGADRIAD